MATPFKDVIVALRNQFFTNWNGQTLVVFDNEPVTTLDTTKPWVRFIVRPNTAQMASFGESGWERKKGILVGTVFVPKTTRDADAYDLADAFTTIFRHWRSADGLIKCDGKINHNIIDNDPEWFRINVTVEWTCEG